MKLWKVKQEVYHRLNKVHDDDLNNVDIVITNNIKEDALLYFNEDVNEWIYPSKSYVVAFCYAYWLSEDYDEDMKELLKDPNLLAGNDPYYKTYDEDPEVYDFLFEKIKLPIPAKGIIPDIREYYKDEFGIE